jgi:hypothetical protein
MGQLDYMVQIPYLSRIDISLSKEGSILLVRIKNHEPGDISVLSQLGSLPARVPRESRLGSFLLEAILLLFLPSTNLGALKLQVQQGYFLSMLTSVS